MKLNNYLDENLKYFQQCKNMFEVGELINKIYVDGFKDGDNNEITSVDIELSILKQVLLIIDRNNKIENIRFIINNMISQRETLKSKDYLKE